MKNLWKTWQKQIVVAAGLVVLLGVETAAYGIVDVQVLRGRRWLSSKNDGETSGTAFDHTMVAAHLGLLPIISIGASVSYLNLTAATKDAIGVSSDSTMEFGIDAQASFSMVPIVTPFARLNIPVMSKYSAKSKAGDKIEVEAVPLESYWATVGIAYPLVPLVSISAEVGTGIHMQRVTKAETNGVDSATGHGKDRQASKNDQFLVGVQVGF